MTKYHWIILIVFVLFVGCSNKEATSEPNFTADEMTNIEVLTWIESGEENFYQLGGVTHDKDGNVYFTDSKSHVIYRVTVDGEVAPFAGYSEGLNAFQDPLGGFQDGSVEEAQFNFPNGLAMDKEQNLYIADSGNGAIRKITASGSVETVVEGLLYPFDIVINDGGEVYFSDALSHQIYKLSTEGEVTVFAGGGYEGEAPNFIGAYKDGTGGEAKFNEPAGLAFTPSGDLLVADAANQRIRRINVAGEVVTVAGSGETFIAGTPYFVGGYVDGNVAESRFNFPKSIAAVDDNRFIVADTYNHALRFIHDGEVTTLAGTGFASFQDGNEANAQFYNPYALTLLDERIIVVDQYNGALREVQYTTK